MPEIYPRCAPHRYAAAFARHGRPSANFGTAGPRLAWPDGLTREEAGLPPRGFVFATFNQLYKVRWASRDEPNYEYLFIMIIMILS